jgi:hypothetical protein
MDGTWCHPVGTTTKTGTTMRAFAILLSVFGPGLTFLLGGLVTALVIQAAPFTITSPTGYLVTALGAAPGAVLSLVAVVLGVWSARQWQRSIWVAMVGGWAALSVAAAIVVAVRYNSNTLPWFFPLIVLPLANLVYWTTHP